MRTLRVLGVAILVSGCLFSGCAPTMTPQEQAAVAAADPLTDEQARNVVLEYIRTTFKDPDSIKDLKVLKPELQKTLTGLYRWSILFSVNAKNSYGAYAGPTAYQILYSQGKILMGLQILSLPERS
jgi:hypothetical protein